MFAFLKRSIHRHLFVYAGELSSERQLEEIDSSAEAPCITLECASNYNPRVSSRKKLHTLDRCRQGIAYLPSLMDYLWDSEISIVSLYCTGHRKISRKSRLPRVSRALSGHLSIVGWPYSEKDFFKAIIAKFNLFDVYFRDVKIALEHAACRVGAVKSCMALQFRRVIHINAKK